MNPCELTARQRSVLDLMSTGLYNKQIARELGISPRTVEFHRAMAMRIIGASNAIHAALIWQDMKAAEAAEAAACKDAPAPRLPSENAQACIRFSRMEAHHRPTFSGWLDGKKITRNGEFFAEAATVEIAMALATALDAAQLLFGPDVPSEIQDDIAAILWPAQPATAAPAAPTAHQPIPPSVSPDLIRGPASLPDQPLESLLSGAWEA